MKISSANGLAGCLIIPVVLAIYAAFSWFFAWLFMLLWNAVVPPVFHGPALTHLQAFLLWILISIVGGAFKSSSSSKS